ncbi:MAG: response regulator [Hyphomicrobiales bacterium]
MHDFSELSVIIADDSSYFRTVMKSVLRGFGIRNMHEAADGADCLHAINEKQPDVLFLDWEMPVFSGPEVMRQIRNEDSQDPFLPVIMVTAHTERARVQQATRLGIHELLCKPVAPKSVYQRLCAVVLTPRPFIRSDSYFGPTPRGYNAPTAKVAPKPAVAEKPAEDAFLL